MRILPWAFLMCGAVAVSAVQFYGNQSAVQWKAAETEHFIFNYPTEYQQEVQEIVSFAEAVHDSVEDRYRVKLPGKVNMVVRNSLFSNGLASPINNTMNVWLTDWDFKVRSTHPWMNDVVTHEFSHLVSIQSGSKFAPYLHGLQLSWQSYSNEATKVDAMGILPFTIYPLWFAEGTAQYESARMGYDAWDTHRDMLLRTEMLDDTVLPLADMREFPANGLGSELGPYTQGFNLVRYISERFGDRAIPNLWSEMARVHRVTFSEACRQVLGISEEQLYQEWKAARLDEYTRVRDHLGTLHAGQKRSHEAYWQDYPQIVGHSLYGVSNMGSPWFEGALFKLPLPGDSLKSFDSLPEGKRPDSTGALSMANFAETPFTLTKAWLEKGFSVRNLAGQSPLVAYVSYFNRDRSGRAYFDIAIDDTSASPMFGDRKSLRFATKFVDAVYPDLSPDGSQVVFVRRELDGARFILSTARVPAVGAGPEDYVDLLVPADSMRIFGIYAPRFSPDGKRILFSIYDGKSRKIAIIDVDGKNLQVISEGAFDSRDPSWSRDGHSILFSCDRTGIFNLYRQSLDSLNQAPQALTNVIGGAFNPMEDSTRIWYVGYDKDGFSLYELPRKDSLPQAPTGVKPIPEPRHISIGALELQGVSRNYLPLPIQPVVVPMISVEKQSDALGSIRHGEPVAKGGVAVGLMDPLQKNFVQLALLLELGKGFDFLTQSGLNPALQSDLLAMWENHSFPITLGAGYMRRNITSRDTVRYEDPRSHNGDSLGINHYAIGVQVLEANAGYSIFKKGDSVVVGGGAQWARFNLYEDGFAWDYWKNQHLTATAVWQQGSDEQSSGIDGAGDGAALSWQGSWSSLYRPGTFRESFTVSSDGVITPIYRKYLLNEAWLSAWYGISNPIQPGARLVGSVQTSGIFSWSGHTNGTDTLDHFFHHDLAIEGYPVYADAENLLLHGDHTALAQLHYLFPLYENLRASWWIFCARDFYMDLFAQAGSAWWNSDSYLDRVQNVDNWKRSLGLEFRFHNTIFLNQPMELWLRLARGLDRVDVNGVSTDLETVHVPLLPSVAEPTSVAFGIGFSFADSWHGMNHSGPRIP